jgi:hypothetical protein
MTWKLWPFVAMRQAERRRLKTVPQPTAFTALTAQAVGYRSLASFQFFWKESIDLFISESHVF